MKLTGKAAQLRRRKAINYIKECRGIHVSWVAAICKGETNKTQRKIGGSAKWHQKWIRRYDLVLAALTS